MSPTNPISERTDLTTHRTPRDGDRRRNPQAAEQFQRALAQQGEDSAAEPDDQPTPDAKPESPTATKLQLGLGSGRKNHGSHSQHVDVVA